jgi:hypothetical protein
MMERNDSASEAVERNTPENPGRHDKGLQTLTVIPNKIHHRGYVEQPDLLRARPSPK